MRIYEKLKLTVSEDTLTEPKLIRFSEELEETDVTTLTEAVLRQETFPVGVNAISLGNIAEGKFLAVKPDADCVVTIDGAALTLKGEKLSLMWVKIATSLTLTISGADQEVLVFVAG
jgi:hypothetical protein